MEGGNYFFPPKGGDNSREGDSLTEGNYFKYCSLEVVREIFCFIIQLTQKIITSNNYLNMGLISVTSLVP